MTEIVKLEKIFSLEITFRENNGHLSVKVCEKEADRFTRNLSEIFDENDDSFFMCETIDDKYVAINLVEIKKAHILWDINFISEGSKNSDPSKLSPEASIEDEDEDEDPITILLKDVTEILQVSPEDYENIYDFYNYLVDGPKVTGVFHYILDEDGEELFINLKELLYIQAPRKMYDEGGESSDKEEYEIKESKNEEKVKKLPKVKIVEK